MVHTIKVVNINNIQVLHIRMGSGMVDIRVDVRVGSCSESPKEYGTAHFLEHVMFKGTAKRTAKDIKKKGAQRLC